MTLKKHKPFSIETMFDDLFGTAFPTTPDRPLVKATQAYHASSDEIEMRLIVDMPGVDPSNVAVFSEGNNIVVKQMFSKVLTGRYRIDSNYDVRQATAKMKNGQLVVRVPRVTSPLQQVKIPVEIG